MADKKTKLADNKTKPTTESVEEFLNQIDHEQKRKDSFVLLGLMKTASQEESVLWSNSFIGFGIKRHKSPATGREADWMGIGFAARKTNLSLYFGDYIIAYADALEKLGKHKTGMGCLYINKLSDVDLKVLQGMIETACQEK